MGECMKHKAKKLIHGVGNNDAGYVTQKYEITEVNGVRKKRRVWECRYYRAWYNMLQRCYSDKYQKNKPTYIGCTVSEDWLTFSNFRTWMEKQNYEGKHLDKDLLFEGNKIYGAKTCVFVSPTVNLFTTDRGNDRGKWLLGVNLDKRTSKFQARCCNPFTKNREFLGHFDSEQEAHNAWAKRKLELAYELAAIQTDERVAKALISKYTNYKQGNDDDNKR